MDLIIHCYGYSGLIHQVLQGIAMFRNAGFYGTVINTIGLIVGIFYAWQISFARVEGAWRVYVLKIFGMLFFINALLLPKTSMLIKDHVEKSFYKVDNIPLAFALPIGAVENFGHIITMGFEQAFSLVGGAGSNSYYHYGTIFGARLAKEVLNAKIKDPEVINNMRNFIARCIVLPASIGHKFTKEELAATNDIWGLVSKNSGTLSRTDMTKEGQRISPSPTCTEAISYFELKFTKEEDGIINFITNKFRGAGKDKEYNLGIRQLNTNVRDAILSLYGSGGENKVDSILKNNMIINAINSYRAGKYAGIKASMQQEAQGLISGDLAEKTLTGSLAVMKVFVYASFIFLLPILIMSGGISKYKSWIVITFSLALWPSLLSILNLIIDFAYEPANIVSYSTWATEKQKFDSVASIAAGLTLSIPFIAYWITKMGEGGFMQLASSITAASNSASSAVAAERASGSRSWDNENIRTSTRDHASSNKINHNTEYVSGENGWNSRDGSMVKITSGGKQIFIGGVGHTSSVGDTTYRSDIGRNAVISEHLSNQRAIAQGKTNAFIESRHETIAKNAALLEYIADSTRTSKGYNIDTKSEENKALVKLLEEIDGISHGNRHTWNQQAIAKVSAELNAGAGVSIPTGSPVNANLGVNVGADGSVGADKNTGQEVAANSTSNKNITNNETGSNIFSAMHSGSWSSEQNIDKQLQEEARNSFEKTKQLNREANISWQKVDTYTKAFEYSNTHGNVSSKDMYQEVLETYALQSNGGSDKVKDEVSRRSPGAIKVFKELCEKDVDSIVHMIEKEKGIISEVEADKKMEEFNNAPSRVIDENVTDKIKDQAAKKGIKKEEIENSIKLQRDKIKNKYEDTFVKNKDSFDITYDYLNSDRNVRANEIRELEDKSFYKSWGGKILGIGYQSDRISAIDRINNPAFQTVRDNNALNANSSINKDDGLGDILPEWKPYDGKK